MKYRGSPAFSHGQADKIGVLVTNLGTPEAPTKGALIRPLGGRCFVILRIKPLLLRKN